jgi:hypothetical protein
LVEEVNPVRKGRPCGVAALYSTGQGFDPALNKELMILLLQVFPLSPA